MKSDEFYIVVSKFGFFSSNMSVHKTYASAQDSFEKEKQSKATEVNIHGPILHGSSFDPMKAPNLLSYAHPCLGKNR